jgi:hypothetical protein
MSASFMSTETAQGAVMERPRTDRVFPWEGPDQGFLEGLQEARILLTHRSPWKTSAPTERRLFPSPGPCWREVPSWAPGRRSKASTAWSVVFSGPTALLTPLSFINATSSSVDSCFLVAVELAVFLATVYPPMKNLAWGATDASGRGAPSSAFPEFLELEALHEAFQQKVTTCGNGRFPKRGSGVERLRPWVCRRRGGPRGKKPLASMRIRLDCCETASLPKTPNTGGVGSEGTTDRPFHFSLRTTGNTAFRPVARGNFSLDGADDRASAAPRTSTAPGGGGKLSLSGGAHN